MKENIIKRLEDLNNDYKTAIVQVIELKKMIENEEEEIELLKTKILKEITEAVDDKGKKIYSNQTSRDNELKIRLKEKYDFNNLKKLKYELERWKGVIEVSKFKQKSIITIANLLLNKE